MWPLWSLILGWILTAVVILGNGLVIYLISTRRKLRTTTNWFVLSLAVADFGVGAIYSTSYSVCWIYPNCADPVKVTVLSIGIPFIYASLTNLCALTLDRYLAIVKPLRYATFMTKKRVALLVFAAWSVAFVILISYVLSAATSGAETIKEYVCIGYVIINVSICVFLLCATARIFLIARKHSQQNAAVLKQLRFNHTVHCKVAETQEAAAAKMVYIVVAVFLCCSLLNTYIKLCECLGFCGPNEILKSLKILRAQLLLTNSAVNPIAYAYFKREIRKELKCLVCSK